MFAENGESWIVEWLAIQTGMLEAVRDVPAHSHLDVPLKQRVQALSVNARVFEPVPQMEASDEECDKEIKLVGR